MVKHQMLVELRDCGSQVAVVSQYFRYGGATGPGKGRNGRRCRRLRCDWRVKWMEESEIWEEVEALRIFGDHKDREEEELKSLGRT